MENLIDLPFPENAVEKVYDAAFVAGLLLMALDVKL